MSSISASFAICSGVTFVQLRGPLSPHSLHLVRLNRQSYRSPTTEWHRQTVLWLHELSGWLPLQWMPRYPRIPINALAGRYRTPESPDHASTLFAFSGSVTTGRIEMDGLGLCFWVVVGESSALASRCLWFHVNRNHPRSRLDVEETNIVKNR